MKFQKRYHQFTIAIRDLFHCIGIVRYLLFGSSRQLYSKTYHLIRMQLPHHHPPNLSHYLVHRKICFRFATDEIFNNTKITSISVTFKKRCVIFQIKSLRRPVTTDDANLSHIVDYSNGEKSAVRLLQDCNKVNATFVLVEHWNNIGNFAPKICTERIHFFAVIFL